MPTRPQYARLTTLLALAIAVVAVVIVLISSGSNYVLHAQFVDAGQLVKGDLVTVAGHQVGSVGGVKLSNNGLADVELDISDGGVTPIRAGTRATIGQLSLTGVANRFVGLSLGTGKPIPSGGALGPDQTKGIVDLDIVLDALNPHVRSQLQRILRTGAYLVRQPTASQANQLFAYLNPAFSQSAQLGREIVADKFALDRLIASTASVASALASRDQDLAGAVSSTAAWLRQAASERTALQDTLARTPPVLHQTTGVLADLDYTLGVLNPALRDLQPVAPRLATLLREVVPVGREAIPTIAGVEALVPSAKQALQGFPPVERQATPAVKSLTAAIGPITPILSALRPYAPDVVAGFFNGVGGSGGGYYDANGHYLHVGATIAGSGASLTGVLGLLGGLAGNLSPLTGTRVGLLARCPGGGAPPAPDGSNGWTAPDVLPAAGTVCDPSQDEK